jgi:hypothetical protein
VTALGIQTVTCAAAPPRLEVPSGGVAEAKGIGYQTVIKVLLHDALKREERTA